MVEGNTRNFKHAILSAFATSQHVLHCKFTFVFNSLHAGYASFFSRADPESFARGGPNLIML